LFALFHIETSSRGTIPHAFLNTVFANDRALPPQNISAVSFCVFIRLQTPQKPLKPISSISAPLRQSPLPKPVKKNHRTIIIF
jgi:hypothetical protein